MSLVSFGCHSGSADNAANRVILVERVVELMKKLSAQVSAKLSSKSSLLAFARNKLMRNSI